jgi:hypothetical protein
MPSKTSGGAHDPKKVLNPRRVRQINGSFAFIEHRFRGFLQYLSPEELLLYFFLVLASTLKQGNGVNSLFFKTFLF